MHVLFSKYFGLYIILFLGVGGLIAYAGFTFYTQDKKAPDLVQVSSGTVTTSVSVSGKVESTNMARLGFAVPGKVQSVLKREGDRVTQGEVLASLTADSLVAEYTAALQNYRYRMNEKELLLQGPTPEERRVTRTSVEIAEEDLERTKREYAELVKNARASLLSTDIEALPINKLNDDTPPIITGNYQCETEGVYTISMFNSKSPTGYSYRLSGLEGGTFTAYTDTPGPLGACGLMIQFDENESYRTQDWTIEIPNTKSSNYITNRNAYTLAKEQERNALSAATQALILARNTEASMNAAPVYEEIEKTNANLASASATLAFHESRIADYTIRAPFDGLITNSDIKIGEIADPTRTITLAREGDYELKVRIPEVDITKVHTDDHAEVTFDASPDTPIRARIEFISPISTEVDGVAYYEARLVLDEKPTWLREGLNADIRIIVSEQTGVLVLPKQFITKLNDAPAVLVWNEGTTSVTPISITGQGTNGYVGVAGIPEGTVVALP